MRKVVINRAAEQIAASKIQNTWKSIKKNQVDRGDWVHPGYKWSNAKAFPGGKLYHWNKEWNTDDGVADAVQPSTKINFSEISTSREHNDDSPVPTANDGSPGPKGRYVFAEGFEEFHKFVSTPLGTIRKDVEAEDFWRTKKGLSVNGAMGQGVSIASETQRALNSITTHGLWVVSYRHGIKAKEPHVNMIKRYGDSYEKHTKKWPTNANAEPFSN
tara:strand:- start:604 stop:1251 length:648 start_codon:yes stop_codon:yes gene_type:complete